MYLSSCGGYAACCGGLYAACCGGLYAACCGGLYAALIGSGYPCPFLYGGEVTRSGYLPSGRSYLQENPYYD